jgi:hypothetical protein
MPAPEVHTVLNPAMVLTKIIRVQHHDDPFASEMLDVANDNDEIWFKPGRAVGERW